MADGKLRKKVRKKLGLSNPGPGKQQKANKAKMQVSPSRKGCCGRSK